MSGLPKRIFDVWADGQISTRADRSGELLYMSREWVKIVEIEDYFIRFEGLGIWPNGIKSTFTKSITNLGTDQELLKRCKELGEGSDIIFEFSIKNPHKEAST